MTVAVAILWGTLALQPAQAAANASVTGRVVAAGAATPLEGAQVMLMPMRRANPTGTTPAFPPGMPPQRTTDADGKFAFEHIIPGEYRINVLKAGYVFDLMLTAAGVPQRPPIQVAGGQALDLGDVALTRGGVIAGRVLDPSGEPVANARVSAMRRVSIPASNLAYVPTGQPSQTNDLGEFRVFGLASGEYIVAAAPTAMASASTASTVLTTTFFPSATDQASATTVAVTAPDSVNGIEIHLTSVPAHKVSGVVVDENGAPVADAIVMLMPGGRGPIMPGPSGNVRTGPNGGFILGGVAAGIYRATASQMLPNGRGGGTASFAFMSGPGQAGTEVVVNDADVSGVRIVIQAR